MLFYHITSHIVDARSLSLSFGNAMLYDVPA